MYFDSERGSEFEAECSSDFPLKQQRSEFEGSLNSSEEAN
jgi:hypothetical protein